MSHFTFLVNDEPYSLWDPDIGRRTHEFLDSFDPEFFTYLAESHIEKLDSPEYKRRVATATRMAYLHGIETLMTLMGAVVQAPQAPYAWVALARTDLLRSVIARISRGDTSLHSELSDWDRTWSGLSKRIFANCTQEAGWQTKTMEGFARAWSIFAGQFLNDMNQLEYNSLKHGFRIRSSGAMISMGREHTYGVAPPPEEMVFMGGSETGSTFYTIEKVGPDEPTNRSRRSRRQTVNWQPEPMLRGLQLIDVSIRNAVSYLQILNGAQPNTIQFQRLADVEDYAAFLHDSVGIRSTNFDICLDESQIPATTKAQLLEELDKAFEKPADS